MIKSILSYQPIWQSQAIALIRVVVGLLMVYHGKEVFDPALMKTYASWDTFKDSSYANTMVYVGKGAELVAGILLTLGLFTRLGAFILLFSMLYIIYFIGQGKIWYEDQHPFMFVLMGVLFLFVGGGRYSLDYKLFNKKKAKRENE
jgi:putative oxidoreductase